MPYTQVTLAQFQADLLAAVEGVPYWTAPEATAAINEAVRVWNLMTGQWKTSKVVPTVAGQHWYSRPDGMLFPFRILWESFPLEPGNIFDLDYGKNGWEGQAMAGTDLPPYPVMWAPVGMNRFVIWPNDTAIHNMVVEGVASAPQYQVNVPSSYLDLQQEDQSAILDYALHYLAFKEGGARFEATYSRFQNFTKQAAARNSKLKAATFYRNMFQGLDLARSAKQSRAPRTPPPEEVQS